MNVGVLGNVRYERLGEMLARVVSQARQLGISLFSEPALGHLWPEPVAPLDEAAPPDLVLTLGGDGTLLRAARLWGAHQIPIMGVNMGRVGFLTTGAPADLEAVLRAIASGAYRVEARKTLESVIIGPDGQSLALPVALNDMVIHKEGVARLVRLRVSLGSREVGIYSADGLIITTPTGSTAYSLSAGGPIVLPGVDAFVITPICAHTLGVRPLVIASTEEVVIQPLHPGADHLMISVDGQRAIRLEPSGRAVVRRAGYDIRLAWLEGVSYFRRMRETLRWGDISEREDSS